MSKQKDIQKVSGKQEGLRTDQKRPEIIKIDPKSGKSRNPEDYRQVESKKKKKIKHPKEKKQRKTA